MYLPVTYFIYVDAGNTPFFVLIKAWEKQLFANHSDKLPQITKIQCHKSLEL